MCWPPPTVPLPTPAYLLHVSCVPLTVSASPFESSKKVFSSIFQNTEGELICTTAYLNLFLSQISEPSLLQVFLKFIFIETFDDKSIVDTLVFRISSQTKV